MSGKYKKYYPKIETNQKNFEFILDAIKSCNSFEEQLELALFALKYATYNNTGYFASSFLENFFVKYANEIDIKNYNINYKQNSFLHVLTKGYNTGGHTRVVERWISQAPNNQVHSVIILNPNSQKLSNLKKVINAQKGTFIALDNKSSIKEKALKLREIGLNYQYIILHTHMDDPTATIAFGTEKFTRPVLLYNHASHMFWIGKSIADKVLEIQSNDYITLTKKNIQNSFYLGIPVVKQEYKNVDKIEIRKKLNLPLDKKIIISSGSCEKYHSICNDNFGSIIQELVNKNTCCYLIGPKEKDFEKINITNKTNIKALGNINFNKGYLDYLAAADLYLDSYPLCGATATMDAIASNIPVLSLKSTYTPLDYLQKSCAFCQTKEELIKKANDILNNKEIAQKNIQELKNLLTNDLSIEVWNKRIEELLQTTPKTHSVKNFKNEIDNKEICDLSVFINIMNDKTFAKKKKIKQFNSKTIKKIIAFGAFQKKQGIPYIFEIKTYNKNNKKLKIIKLFNITIFSYTK